MMMRSAPAASAHLAEIPVPAPAPMMGIPAAPLSRHRFRHAARSIRPFFPFARLNHKATIRLRMPHSERKFGTSRVCVCSLAAGSRLRPSTDSWQHTKNNCRTRRAFRPGARQVGNAALAACFGLVLFGFLGHLFVQLSEFVALDGLIVERLYKVLAMADGACLVLLIREARIRLVRRNHRHVFLRLVT